MIYVRTIDGRVARTSPRGQPIPHDQFIPVEATPYINRLIDHGDIMKKPPEQSLPRAPVSADPPPLARDVAVTASPVATKKKGESSD